jgi:uncharacterized membrane protein
MNTLKNLLGFVQNGALVAVIAHGLIGISLVWDKVLLKNPGTKNLYSYVFWLGAISVFGMILLGFGYKSLPFWIAVIAFVGGALDLVASYFYYAALKAGEISDTLAIMGGFAPVATALFALLLLSNRMSRTQLLGFALMTAGGFVMFFSEKLPLKKILPPVLLASAIFGLVNVLEKLVYNHTNFVTGYVWFTIGTFAGSMAMLLPPSWRKQIFSESHQSTLRNRFWYFVNRFMAGLGSFLIFYAISLTHPAVVNAISGVRYAIVFVGAYLLTKFRPLWLKEDFTGMELVTKTLGTCLVVAGVVVVGLAGGKTSASAILRPDRSPIARRAAACREGTLATRLAVFLAAKPQNGV